MPGPEIKIMPTPRPCGICGRPTTQFHTRLEIPFCGRDDEALTAAGRKEDFGPIARGRTPRWQRWSRQRSSALR
jgi:hypothetical protein